MILCDHRSFCATILHLCDRGHDGKTHPHSALIFHIAELGKIDDDAIQPRFAISAVEQKDA